MSPQKLLKVRLAINAIACLAISVLFLPLGLAAMFDLVSGTAAFGRDPDGADKVLAASLFSGVIGAVALISLVRTVKRWRAMSAGAR